MCICVCNYLRRYKNIPTYVTENGLAWQEDTVEQAVNDTMRQQYLHDHIDAVGQALQSGCDVKGYFVWSFQVCVNCKYVGNLLRVVHLLWAACAPEECTFCDPIPSAGFSSASRAQSM